MRKPMNTAISQAVPKTTTELVSLSRCHSGGLLDGTGVVVSGHPASVAYLTGESGIFTLIALGVLAGALLVRGSWAVPSPGGVDAPVALVA
jgi:hypothetical protein